MSEEAEVGSKHPRSDEGAFKGWVKEYVAVDDNILLVNDKAKTWKDKRKDLDARIKEYMESNNILGCNLADGALVLKATKKRPALNRKYLEDKIGLVVTNDVAKQSILDSIFDEGEVTTKYNLKRIKEEKRGTTASIDIES